MRKDVGISMAEKFPQGAAPQENKMGVLPIGRLLTNIQACTAGQNNITCYAATAQEVQDAHAVGLSYGKYRAYLELQALDPSVTPDDIRDLSMREIRDRIAALSGEEEQTTTPSGGNHAGGQGQRNGYRGGRGKGNP